MITSPQPLRADEVLDRVHINNKVLYRWNGQELVGIVAGWRAMGFGKSQQHLCLIYRHMEDRAVPLSDIIGRL